ncbi:MAG: pre-peptidase C-terminal domain-containing protein, partial [Pirellulales bacterium]
VNVHGPYFSQGKNDSLVLQGTVDADTSGGALYVEPTGSGTLTNAGAIAASTGSSIHVIAVTINDGGVLKSQPGSTISISGSLVGNTEDASLYNPQGTTILDGAGTALAPQLVEAMSQDLGPVSAGFQNNFAYGSLLVGGGDYVQLIDQAANSVGGGAEAVCANSLVVPAGSTLDLNGLQVYVRVAQVNGTVVNGSVHVLPSGGGPLSFSQPTPASLRAGGSADDWTFFGHAGQTVTVVVNTGGQGSFAPLQPSLNYAQVQLRDPNGNLLATATNSQIATDAVLFSVPLTVDGTYHIHVQAPQSQPSAAGNYIVTLWNATINQYTVNLNEQANGELFTPYSADHWSFAAVANQQIKFDLINSTTSAIQFDLTGPNGYSAFSGITTSSSLITLPASGAYVLSAHWALPVPGYAAYAFQLRETSVSSLTLGTVYDGALAAGDGQAQLFTVTVPQGGNPLLINLAESSSTDQDEIYASLGSPPTLSDYQHRYSQLASASQQILVPAAASGTWYILLYGNYVPASSNFTLTAATRQIVLSSSTPSRYGTSQDTV